MSKRLDLRDAIFAALLFLLHLALAGPLAAAVANTEVENRLKDFFAEVYGGETVEARIRAGKEAEKYLESVKDRFKRHPFMHEFYMGQVKMYQGLAEMTAWEEDPARTASRDKARRLYKEAAGIFERVVQAVVGKMEVLEGGGGKVKRAGKRRASRRRRTARAKRMPPIYDEYQNVLSQINYYMGWTYYRLARTLTNKAEKDSALEASLAYFQLQVGDKITGEFNLVKSPLAADCFVGQGLVFAEQNKPKRVIELFKGLSAKNVAREVWPQILLLRVEAYMTQGQYRKVIADAAKVAVAALHAPQPTVVELQVQLRLLEAYAMGTHREEAQRENWSRQAVPLVLSLIGRGEPWSSEAVKILDGIKGKSVEPVRQVLSLEKLFAAKKYAQVAARAAAALETLNEKTQKELVVRARFLAGASLLASGDTEKGLAHLNRLLEKAPKHELTSRAVDACITAQWRTAEGDPSEKNVAALFAGIERVRKSFPDHEILKRAPWFEGAILYRRNKFDKALEKLAAVGPKDVDYASAKLMMVNASITLARGRKERGEAEKYLDGAGMELKALEKFNAQPGPAAQFLDMDALRRATAAAAVALAEAYLRPPVMNAKKAVASLKDFDKRFPGAKGLKNNIRTIESEALLAAGDTEGAVKSMRALLASGKGTEGMGVVVRLANRMEANISALREAGKEKEAAAKAVSLAKIYESLGDYFAERGKADSVEARTVLLRRARAFELAREYGEADKVYKSVLKELEKLPASDEKRGLELLVTRGLALMDEARGDEAMKKGKPSVALPLYASARERWRLLGGSFKARTDEWFEARYHLTLMHYKIGKEKKDLDGAWRVIRYFELTNPGLGGPEWKGRFLALKKKISEHKTGGTR